MEEAQERAVAALGAETSLPGLLHAAAREFVEVVDGDACAISRVVGDVLIQVAEHARDGRTLVRGHGYLISDFPLTEAALRHGEPHCISLLDPAPDPREASVLTELKVDSLLMLPLMGAAGGWGLAEIYVHGAALRCGRRRPDAAACSCVRRAARGPTRAGLDPLARARSPAGAVAKAGAGGGRG